MNEVSPPNALYIQEIPDTPDNQTLIRKITKSNIVTSLISPLRLLRHGHILLLIYLGLLLTLMFWTCSELDTFLSQHLIAFGKDLRISSETLQQATLFCTVCIWALCVPVLLVAVALPTEDLWLYQKINLFRMLKLTPTNVFVTFQTLVLGTRNVFYFLIPLFATIVGYLYAAQHGYLAQIPPVLHMVAFVILLSVLWKATPVILAPIVAICGQYTTAGALANAPGIVHKSWFNLVVILLIGALITIPAVYGIQQLELEAKQQTLAYLITVSTLLWYTLSAATHELMIATGKVVFGGQQ
jgi:hypothetical protein